MKISKQDKNRIIENLLPRLLPANEPGVAYDRKMGEELLQEGHTHIQGKPILYNHPYKWPRKVQILVNHRRRLAKIIDGAPDYPKMTDRLADYLKQHGKHFKERKLAAEGQKGKEAAIIEELTK